MDTSTPPPEPASSKRPVVAVVGGGISGLAAAWYLLEEARLRGDDAPAVVVLESSTRLGGALRAGTVGELTADLGAESMLARRPEALDLVSAAGLDDDVVHPRTSTATIWSRGHLHPLPAGTFMGVPGYPDTLPGVLTGPEVARVVHESVLAPPEGDVAVGPFVADRVGRAVVDRLVEPLLGGVYAGHAGRLSFQATMPALWQELTSGRADAPAHHADCRLVVAARRTVEAAAASANGGPVFAGLRGGVGRLPEALAAVLRRRGVRIRTGVTVRALAATATGWRLECGPAPAPEWLDAGAVILAVPPTPAARLLRPHAPLAAARLGAVETASVALVAAVLPREVLRSAHGSGVLVPPVERLAVKAATFCSAKWDWVDTQDTDHVLVRLSLGRAREEAVLQRDDDDLADLATADLTAMIGRPVRPVATRVIRWGGALPQYAVGHVAAMASVREDVDGVPGLALCGAVLDGVGIPACAAAARTAARRVTSGLGQGWGRMEQ